jgi:hypothetical protein
VKTEFGLLNTGILTTSSMGTTYRASKIGELAAKTVPKP